MTWKGAFALVIPALVVAGCSQFEGSGSGSSAGVNMQEPAYSGKASKVAQGDVLQLGAEMRGFFESAGEGFANFQTGFSLLERYGDGASPGYSRRSLPSGCKVFSVSESSHSVSEVKKWLGTSSSKASCAAQYSSSTRQTSVSLGGGSSRSVVESGFQLTNKGESDEIESVVSTFVSENYTRSTQKRRSGQEIQETAAEASVTYPDGTYKVRFVVKANLENVFIADGEYRAMGTKTTLLTITGPSSPLGIKQVKSYQANGEATEEVYLNGELVYTNK